MHKKTNMVFICSPFRGDTRFNTRKAREYARFAVGEGYSPVVPHLLFPQFLDDMDAEERILGIEMGLIQMKQCDQIWIFGTDISVGMEHEIKKSQEMFLPTKLFDEACHPIKPDTLRIDDRVDKKFLRVVTGSRLI